MFIKKNLQDTCSHDPNTSWNSNSRLVHESMNSWLTKFKKTFLSIISFLNLHLNSLRGYVVACLNWCWVNLKCLLKFPMPRHVQFYFSSKFYTHASSTHRCLKMEGLFWWFVYKKIWKESSDLVLKMLITMALLSHQDIFLYASNTIKCKMLAFA